MSNRLSQVNRFCVCLGHSDPVRRNKNIIGSKVREYRLENGWSQSELATKCQLMGFDAAKATIGQIEIGYRSVTDLEMAIFASIFSISTDDLLPENLPRWKTRG